VPKKKSGIPAGGSQSQEEARLPGAAPGVPVLEPRDIAELQRIQEQLRLKAEELETINSIAASTNASLDLGTILDNAIESVMHTLQADLGVIYLFDPDRPGQLYPSRYRGLSRKDAHTLIPTRVATSQTWRAIDTHEVILIPDTSALESFPPVYTVGISGFVTIPLFSKDRPLGALNLGMRKGKSFKHFSIAALTGIGNQIGVAIEHAALLESREKEIEQRRNAEAALRASETRYRQTIDTSPEAVALTDAAGNYLIANESYALLFGYASSADFMDEKLQAGELMAPEFLVDLAERQTRLKPGESIRNVRGQMKRRDGTLFTAEISASMIRDSQGNTEAVIGIIRDVTEIQQFEEALRRSEERYRTLAEAANDMIFIIDAEDRIVYVNRFAARYFGCDPSQLIGKPRSELFTVAASRHMVSNLQKVFRVGKAIYAENKVDFPGFALWLSTWLVPILDNENRVVQVLGLARDITDYKETAQRLAESEQRFRDIIERSADGYYFLDNEGFYRSWNQALLNILQLLPEEMVNRCIFDHPDVENRERMVKIFARVKGGKNIVNEELPLYLHNETHWLNFSARRVIKDGIVIGVEGFFRDVTGQKRVAEALRVSEARYRSLFDSIRYEVYGMDLDGRYQDTNAAFQEAWGPALGRTVTEVVKERTAVRHFKQLIKRVLATHVTVQASFSLKRVSGLIHYSAILSPVLTKDGHLIGLVGMNLDVTDQMTTLESLRTLSKRMVQVQEEERRRIAREIHDSLGQHLTALQLEVTAASLALAATGTPPKALMDAVKTIEESLTMAQNLCYDLRPPLLDDFGLEAALRDHFAEYEEKWQIPVQFECERLEHVLSRDAETALFRVAQEALNNVLKHARAQEVRVWLGRLKNQIVLRIEDNGRGFEPDEGKRPDRNGHFGLMTMKERIELLGGEFDVETAPGKGTVITAVLPARMGENR